MKPQNAQIEESTLNLDCVTLTPEILGEIQSIQNDSNNDDQTRLQKLFNFLFGIYHCHPDSFAGEEKIILEHMAFTKDLQAHFEIFKIKQTSIVASVSKSLVSTLKIVD